MGYRSDIVIAVSGEVMTRHLIANDIPKSVLENASRQRNGNHYFCLESWKWYEEYPEVREILDWFDEMSDENHRQFGALRMGEEFGDIETWGDPNNFEIYATQSISY